MSWRLKRRLTPRSVPFATHEPLPDRRGFSERDENLGDDSAVVACEPALGGAWVYRVPR